MRSFCVAAVVVLGAALAAPTAEAAFIDGSFSMTGGFTPSGGASLGTATGLDFHPKGPGGTFTVDGARTGDFTILAEGTKGTIKDFTFNPFAGPLTNFWQVADFSFDLGAANVVYQNSIFLLIAGSGTVRRTGFDDTPGNWNFSGQSAGRATFSWSASSIAIAPPPVPVPEPATLAVVGMGLGGLGLLARRRRKTPAAAAR